MNAQPVGTRGVALARHGYALGAAQVLPGQRIRLLLHTGEGALRNHAPAMHAGTGAHVDQVVGGAHHVFVMLDDQHAVADVAQMLERADQPVVVALVQAYAGLVQHVHHAGQAGADLAGQANALRFATGQGIGAAVQAQVVQTHVVQELEARADLAHHLVGDLGLGTGELQRAEIGVAVAQRGMADLVDRAQLIAVAQLHIARLAPQPGAAAVAAGLLAAVARQLFAHRDRIGLTVAPRHVRDDAFERMFLRQLLAGRGARVHHVAEANFLFAGAVQNHLTHRRRQRLERRIDVKAIVLGQAFQHRKVIAVAPVPALDRATGQAQRRKGHDPLRIEEFLRTQAIAAGAGTHG